MINKTWKVNAAPNNRLLHCIWMNLNTDKAEELAERPILWNIVKYSLENVKK